MAKLTLVGSILALMTVLAAFAGNSPVVMGQTGGVGFHIVNFGDSAVGAPLSKGFKVNCYDICNCDPALPPATLLPGQTLDYSWLSVSNDGIYQCDFELDAPSGVLKQRFEVWNQDTAVTNFLQQCAECTWRVLPDGFYWFSPTTSQWIKEYGWTS